MKDTVLRKARSDWREEAMSKLKLEMTGRLMESEFKAHCVWLDYKRHWRMMSRLRGGTAELANEVGRWHKVGRRHVRCVRNVEMGR